MLFDGRGGDGSYDGSMVILLVFLMVVWLYYRSLLQKSPIKETIFKRDLQFYRSC